MLFKIITFLFIIVTVGTKEVQALTEEQKRGFEHDYQGMRAFLLDQEVIYKEKRQELERAMKTSSSSQPITGEEKRVASLLEHQQKTQLDTYIRTLEGIKMSKAALDNRLREGFEAADLPLRILRRMQDDLGQRYYPAQPRALPSSASSGEGRQAETAEPSASAAQMSSTGVPIEDQILTCIAQRPLVRLVEPESMEEKNGRDLYERFLLSALLSTVPSDDINELFKEFIKKKSPISPYFIVLKAYVLGLIGTPPDGFLCYENLAREQLVDLAKNMRSLDLLKRLTMCQVDVLMRKLEEINKLRTEQRAASDSDQEKQSSERTEKDILAEIETMQKKMKVIKKAEKLYEEHIQVLKSNIEILKPLRTLLSTSQELLDKFESNKIKRGFYLEEQTRKEKQMKKNRKKMEKRDMREQVYIAQKEAKALAVAASAETDTHPAAENADVSESDDIIDPKTQAYLQNMLETYRQETILSESPRIRLPLRLWTRVQEFYTASSLPFKRFRYVLETIFGGEMNILNRSKRTFHFTGLSQDYVAYENPNEQASDVGPHQLVLARNYIREHLGLFLDSFESEN